jgi:hypothetical protein
MALPTAPNRISSTIDGLRTPVVDVATTALGAGVAYAGAMAVIPLPMGMMEMGAMAVFTAGAMGSLHSIYHTGTHQIVPATSLLHAGLAKLSGRRSIASAASAMIEAEWDRSKITTQSWGKSSYRGERRMMRISLPNGSVVYVLHRRDKRPLVVLRTHSGQPFDPKASLGVVGTAKVIRTIERIQAERLSFMLGLPDRQSPTALSRILAETLPCKSDDDDVDKGERGFNGYHQEELHTIEKRYLKSLGILVTSIRPKHGSRHSEVFAESPGLGVMLLPTDPFRVVMARRRSNGLHEAFGSATKSVVTVPVFLGNARASRIADLARQALSEDPALTDANGSPIRSLIEEHMPRLLSVHRQNALTARSSDIAEIDSALDRGLDVVARALGDAIDGLADRKLDELRTEVRFLESRHPDPSTSPLALRSA